VGTATIVAKDHFVKSFENSKSSPNGKVSDDQSLRGQFPEACLVPWMAAVDRRATIRRTRCSAITGYQKYPAAGGTDHLFPGSHLHSKQVESKKDSAPIKAV
jgi:hypothetical protein